MSLEGKFYHNIELLVDWYTEYFCFQNHDAGKSSYLNDRYKVVFVEIDRLSGRRSE